MKTSRPTRALFALCLLTSATLALADLGLPSPPAPPIPDADGYSSGQVDSVDPARGLVVISSKINFHRFDSYEYHVDKPALYATLRPGAHVRFSYEKSWFRFYILDARAAAAPKD